MDYNIKNQTGIMGTHMKFLSSIFKIPKEPSPLRTKQFLPSTFVPLWTETHLTSWDH